jgi:hypothetical protein
MVILTNEEKILKHRNFWKYHEPIIKKGTEKERIRKTITRTLRPPIKGAKERVFKHYCDGEPRCFWPGGCDVKNITMLQLHHINGDGKQHKERLKNVAGNFYVALEIEGFPQGLKPLCANHHILIHTNNGAYWENFL